MPANFPSNQGALIRAARGGMTQAEFAEVANVGRTALCRYETQKRGVPPEFLNFCLDLVSKQLDGKGMPDECAKTALAHARQTVQALERLAKDAPAGDGG